MFSDSRMQTISPELGYLRSSDYGDALGLLDSSGSCLYTDWMEGEQRVGRSISALKLPVMIEGANSIAQDDFWNELQLPNTPIAAQLPRSEKASDQSSGNNVLFDASSFQAHEEDAVAFGNSLDMFDVGIATPHGGHGGEGSTGSQTHVLEMQSFHVQSKHLFTDSVIPSSFDGLDETADILEANANIDFILPGSSTAGASINESKPITNARLNQSIEGEKDQPVKQSIARDDVIVGKGAWKDHSKRTSIQSKRTLDQFQQTSDPQHQQQQHHQHHHQANSAAPPSSTGKSRNSHSASASQAAKESRWAEQLLTNCASAIASRNIVRTQHLMWVLNDLASLAGDANQRLAAYGLKALFSKITGSVATASAYHQRHPPATTLTPKSINHALLKFHEVNPLHQFVYTLTNGLLVEALESKQRLHIIDIGISQGTQWPTFIEAMATRACGAPEVLRLTILDDPCTPFRSTSPGEDSSSSSNSSSPLKMKLERFAKVIGINLQLQIITIPLEDLTPEALSIKSDETLAICAQFRLHRLMETLASDHADDSASSCGSNTRLCQRDRFLQLLHSLKAELIVLNDNAVDQLAEDFMRRFSQVTDHHWRFLDSMSASFKGRDCEERQTIEQELAMALVNNVACEGWARVERNDSHVGWCQRMRTAGFQAHAPTDDALETVRVLLRKYDSNWDFVVDSNCVVLQWKQQPMTFCSVWR